jgi:hypothetical protein
MGDETIRSHLHGFWGEIWPARGGWGEKMRKNVRKKTKYAHKCARKIHGRAQKERKTAWVIGGC